MYYRIAQLAAQIYAGKDWHELSDIERALVADLEKQGCIIPNTSKNGFVGRASNPPESEDTHL